MKRNHFLSIMLILFFGIIFSCRKDFLEVRPNGGLDEFVLSTDKGIDALSDGSLLHLTGYMAQFVV
jgi:hypothetical protein